MLSERRLPTPLARPHAFAIFRQEKTLRPLSRRPPPVVSGLVFSRSIAVRLRSLTAVDSPSGRNVPDATERREDVRRTRHYFEKTRRRIVSPHSGALRQFFHSPVPETSLSNGFSKAARDRNEKTIRDVADRPQGFAYRPAGSPAPLSGAWHPVEPRLVSSVNTIGSAGENFFPTGRNRNGKRRDKPRRSADRPVQPPDRRLPILPLAPAEQLARPSGLSEKPSAFSVSQDKRTAGDRAVTLPPKPKSRSRPGRNGTERHKKRFPKTRKPRNRSQEHCSPQQTLKISKL